ncbi:MAG: TFIIB-type zinc ribbon-containing protein [Planctomycetaceae bacterium]|nr:TFIIB-type zinc ribbon-containing protein [Planctomycetaceae bacterium]
MTIEYICPQCQRTLRVSDESAGMHASCPECGTVAEVPAPAGGGFPGGEASHTADAHFNPYSAPTPSSAPMTEFQTGEIRPTAVEFGQVFNVAWEAWKGNLGVLVGAFVIMLAVNIGFSMVEQGIQVAIRTAKIDQDVAVALVIMLNFASNLVGMFLGIGQARISLKVVRRQEAAIGDLFGGGHLFLSVLGASIVAGIAVMLGFIALIVPGILLCLFYWPYYQLIVDEKAKAMESFNLARSIARENVGTAFLVWLVSIAISIAGCLALCVGIIFAIPLVSVMWATAYLMMSGQVSVQPQPGQNAGY